MHMFPVYCILFCSIILRIFYIIVYY